MTDLEIRRTLPVGDQSEGLAEHGIDVCVLAALEYLRYLTSYETDCHPDDDVAALDPLADPSRDGRYRPWDIEGRVLKHCAVRPRGLPVRDARARRTAIGARHHAARRVVRGSHARHPHEGGTLRRDCQVHRRLLLRLDTLGARRARGLHLHPLRARTLEPASAPVRPIADEPQPPAASVRFKAHH